MLDAMTPAFGRSARASDAARRPEADGLRPDEPGDHAPVLLPGEAGADYATAPYLSRLTAHRDRITVFSGVSLPGVTGGHQAERYFLTGTPHPERGGFRNEISLDQFAAERVGNRTRHPSLVLAMTQREPDAQLHPQRRPDPGREEPKKVVPQALRPGQPGGSRRPTVEALKQGRSMLDFLGDETARLNRSLSAADRSRLDQYFTSVRELEGRMHASEDWERKPKPVVAAGAPEDVQESLRFVDKTRQFFDLIQLALETDSTRVVSLFIDTTVIHNITHHGNRPEVVAELRGHESASSTP